MPSSIEAFALLLLAILPGFIAVAVEKASRPIRTHAPMDAVVWCACYSIVINSVLILGGSWIALKWYQFDPAPLIDKGWREWVGERIKAAPLSVEFFSLGYLAASIVLAFLFGKIIARITWTRTPVWYLETVQRTTCWSWFRLKGRSALSVKVNFSNGATYFGTLQAVPKDYEVLVAKEKDFSIVRAVYVPPPGKDGTASEPIILGQDEVVLLNTKDVVSIQTTEEQLDSDAGTPQQNSDSHPIAP
ncbi:MAG TPA: DUF6338 family protein [Pirellulales bacterium]|jgi:hypothetical protein|nr:DUF6338 family protein [Pirellulales bacterium]